MRHIHRTGQIQQRPTQSESGKDGYSGGWPKQITRGVIIKMTVRNFYNRARAEIWFTYAKVGITSVTGNGPPNAGKQASSRVVEKRAVRNRQDPAKLVDLPG